MLHCALTQSSFVCLIRIFSLRHRKHKICICSVIKLVSFTGRRRWGRKSTFVRLQLTSTAFSLHSVLCGYSLFEMFYNIETNICSYHRWNMVHEPTTTVLRLTVKKWMVYDEFLMNKQQISLVSMFAHHHRTYMHPTMLMPTRKLYLILRLDWYCVPILYRRRICRLDHSNDDLLWILFDPTKNFRSSNTTANIYSHWAPPMCRQSASLLAQPQFLEVSRNVNIIESIDVSPPHIWWSKWIYKWLLPEQNKWRWSEEELWNSSKANN